MPKKDDNIIVTGYVEDVREHIKDACLAAATVRIGAGVQNKILETMSMGIPTITTEFGADGITDDRSILPVAYDAQDFADKIIEIINNPDKRNSMRKVSRIFCEQNFSIDTCLKKFEEIFDKVKLQ